MLTHILDNVIIRTERRNITIVKKVLNKLKEDGWVFVSQKGSHMKFKKDNLVCIIPNHRGDIPKGTLSQISRSTGIKF